MFKYIMQIPFKYKHIREEIGKMIPTLIWKYLVIWSHDGGPALPQINLV